MDDYLADALQKQWAVEAPRTYLQPLQGCLSLIRSTGTTLHDTAAAFLATRDAVKDAAKFKVVHLGSEYDLVESDEAYRLVAREGYFDDKGYF